MHELPAENLTQVSGVAPKPLYRVRFTTLETLLDDDGKKRLGADVARAIYEAEGSAWDEREAQNPHWVSF